MPDFLNADHLPDPNAVWPRYAGPDARDIVFDVNATDLHYTAKDEYRQEGIAYILDHVYT